MYFDATMLKSSKPLIEFTPPIRYNSFSEISEAFINSLVFLIIILFFAFRLNKYCAKKYALSFLFFNWFVFFVPVKYSNSNKK